MLVDRCDGQGENSKQSPVGKTKDVGWQISLSHTIASDLDDGWSSLMSTEGIAVWLGDGVATPLKSARNTRPPTM